MVNLGRLLALFAVVLYTGKISAQQPDSTFWVPNGPVHSLVLHDTTVILGGDFDMVTPLTGSFVRLDTTTGLVDPSLYKVNGTVYATCYDDRGNIYVGGNFSRVGNIAVSNLFRLRPDGTFDPTFSHSVGGIVYCLASHDTSLFIGGEFATVDDETRNNFAGISLNLDIVNACNPDVNGPVYCMDIDLSDASIIIGGDFNNVGTFNPPFLAKIDMVYGIVFTFNAVPWTAVPNLNGPVYDVHIVDFRCYIAGEFTMFANIPRTGLASLWKSNGTLQAEDAQVTGAVYDMEFADSMIYIGGSFTSVGGQFRSNIACVSETFGLKPWNPGSNGTVYDITSIDKTRLFVGGDFTMFGFDTCTRGAIIRRSLDFAENWNPQMNAPVYTAVCDTNLHLYVGGAFYGAGGALRKNLCAISVNNGKATAWNPGANAPVRTMVLDGDALYLAGDFQNIGGVSRARIAALDLAADTVLAFNPGVNGLVRAMAVTPTEVYAGGNFTIIGGQPRSSIALLNKSTGQAQSWNPNCLGTVNSILVSPQWIYVAGFYGTISGVQRNNLSRIHPANAVADPTWICDTDDGIYHAEFYNNGIVMAGWFDVVNGQSATDFTILDTASVQPAAVNFTCDGFAKTFTRYGDDFFIAGMFDLVNSGYHPHLVSYDAGDNAADSWAPFPDADPETMQATATRLFIGGSMTTTAGRFHPNFQVLPVQWVTGIEETAVQSTQLHVFPNPASDIITVSNTQEFSRYTLTDVAGQVVMTGIVSTATLEISLAELAPGMYVLTLSGDAVVPASQTVIRK